MPKFSGLDPMFGGQSGELRKVDDAQKEQEKWYQNQLDLLEQNRQHVLTLMMSGMPESLN
ncbi:Uncharacterised protein [Klebsiella pneumoniae]|uniref:Uncharacterized protein n=1 Tax=Klebsiella pneumoniae TaxID=573 RepID=A0A378A2B6_KLEPN|nr:Uncharacterised protein [Klebsiella pneumoniae]